MRPDPIESLLPHLGEVNALERAAGLRVHSAASCEATVARAGASGWLRRGPFAAAAALLLAAMLPWRAPTGVGSADRGASGDSIATDSVHFSLPHPCTDEASFAVLFFRTWSAECGCELWNVHEPTEGEVLVPLPVGESGTIAVRLADRPIGDMVFLAVARQRDTLPTNPDDAHDLLHCLNISSFDHAEEPGSAALACAVERCMPEEVAVITQPLLRRLP